MSRSAPNLEPAHGLRVMVEVRISMRELSEWPPDRATALLEGIAQLARATRPKEGQMRNEAEGTEA